MGDVKRLADVIERASLSCVSDEDVRAYERDRERDRRLEWLRSSRILDALPPAMVAHVGSDRLESTESLDVVRRWAAYQNTGHGEKPVLFLLGNMGRGKTVAAAWLIAREGGRYVEAEELCRLQSARWGDEAERYQRTLGASVLVIDELGTESDSRAAMHDVINRRQGRRLTLVMGNLSRRDLEQRLDPRTWDRMRTCAVIAEVHGESMRKGAL